MPDSLSIGERLNQFNDLEIIIKRVPPIKIGFFKKLILNLRLIQSNAFDDINSIKYEQLKKKFAFLILDFFLKPVSFSILQYFIDKLILYSPTSKIWNRIFAKHNIDLLFLSTPGQKFFDLDPIQIAKKNKITTFSSIYSLDNLTAKGYSFLNTDYLSVWNNTMKEDAVNLHGYISENVFVDGSAIADNFYKFKNISNDDSRINFLNSIGLKSTDKFITIATIPQFYWGKNHILLTKDILSMDLNVIVLIKPHPMDVTNYDNLGSSRVVIDPFHGGFEANKYEHNPTSWRTPSNHIENLSNIMMYSELVINVASSIAIDASIFNTPGINIAFDYETKNQALPSKYLYKYTHYKRIIDTNGTYFSHDSEMLKTQIENILSGNDPANENRKTMARNIYGIFDGNSIDRIVNNIEKIL